MMKNKRLEALIKKAAAQATSDKSRKPRFVDPTLKATGKPEEGDPEERKHFFKEMKRREF
jgi:hypothetical protein